MFRDVLLQSESYTRTDMLYLTKGGFWLSVARIVGMATSLLLAVAMANLLTPQVYGTYRFVLAGAGIIGAFSLFGMGTAVTRAVAQGYEGVLRAGRKEMLRWGIFIALMSFGAALYYFLNGNIELATSFAIVGIFHPLFSSFLLYGSFIAGKKDFKTQAIYSSVQNAIPAALLAGTVFFTNSPVLVVLAYFASQAGIAFVLYVATLRVFRPNDSVDAHTLRYGKHLSLMGIIGKVAENLDKVLVFHYVGAVELAIYAFALTPITHLKMLNDIPAQLAFPKLSERPIPELRRTLPRKVLLLSAGMALIALMYAMSAPYIFQLIFPQYISSVFFTQVLAFTLIPAPFILFNQVLVAHMKKRELYISRIALPVLKIGLLLILLPLFGIWGAVSAIIITQIASMILYGLQLWRAA